MKSLYLVRHAKSSREDPGCADEQRPLLDKGVKKTGKVVKYLLEKKVKPDQIVSSHAVRAFETARIIAGGLDYPPEKIRIDRKIYDGYYDRILDIIYATPNDINSLMIVGHNPTITNLANLFLHPGIEDMPTSAVVSITFDTDQWEKIPSVESTQEFMVYPKMLKQQ
jgi:phosphohistidine phosphatase